MQPPLASTHAAALFACVLSDRDGPGRVERVGSANPYTNQIEPARVVRAFQFFQKSCGGPYRSSF